MELVRKERKVERKLDRRGGTGRGLGGGEGDIGFGMVPHSQRTQPLIPSPPPIPNSRDNHIFSQMRKANQHLGKKPLHPFGVDLLHPFHLGDSQPLRREVEGSVSRLKL